MKKFIAVLFAAVITVLPADEIRFDKLENWQESSRLTEKDNVFTLRGAGRFVSNELLLVDPSMSFKLTMKIRRSPGSPAFRSHIGFAQFDNARVELRSVWYRAEWHTETSLRQAAAQNTATLVVGKPAWWPEDVLRRGWEIAFDTKSDFSDLPNRTVIPLKDWKETEKGILTLTVSSSVPKDYPEGTAVRFHSPGPPMYPILAGTEIKEEWTEVSGTVFGESKSFHNNRWWRGATFFQLLISNSPTTADRNLSFEFKDVALTMNPTNK